MSVDVIEIEGLRKVYRRLRGRPSVALDGLDLAVPSGGVFGFLGPNGSGKTTTIRCLLGLVRPTAGGVSLLGRPVPEGLAGTMGRVGAIVEAPALFPTMTGRENLRLLAALDGIGRRRVDDVLAEVGLEHRAGDAVKRYSLGMRQRLGLAAALLKDPELLVLDEPANGLDPAGIREIRVLLRRLGAEGRTVFVSSHLLSEVEQTCDSVAILRAGRCVAAGPVRQVLAGAGPAAVVVRMDDLDAGRRILARAGFTAERVGDHLRVDAPTGRGAAINRALAESGVWASELRCDEVTLEELFLRLTAETREEAA
ncbi:MAG TPA: ABC transporter ATP-binding protein [Acidimicrobiales bacterium]|nr:ABC transporter ATP-binding protein [Acidimicrobiales bacterium]